MPYERDIANCLRDLENGKYSSIRRAASAYNLDPSTVSRRRRGQKTRRESQQPQQLLSPTCEEMLTKWLLDCEKNGHAFNQTQLREMASIISRVYGGAGIVGKNWVLRYLKRHPQVKTKKGNSIANERIEELLLSEFKA